MRNEIRLKVIPHICTAQPFCAWFMTSFSTPACTRMFKTWRICLDIEFYQLKNDYNNLFTNEHGHPTFSSSHCNQLIVSFPWQKANLISLAENWINKENSRYTVVFSICRLVTMSRNLVQILIKDSAFWLIQTWNVWLCPTQRFDCSSIHVLVSLVHKNLQLLLGMRS